MINSPTDSTRRVGAAQQPGTPPPLTEIWAPLPQCLNLPHSGRSAPLSSFGRHVVILLLPFLRMYSPLACSLSVRCGHLAVRSSEDQGRCTDHATKLPSAAMNALMDAVCIEAKSSPYIDAASSGILIAQSSSNKILMNERPRHADLCAVGFRVQDLLMSGRM